MKKRPERMISGDIVCCEEPPPSCPRRYCSIAFRSFERSIGTPEPVKKKRGKAKGKDKR
jgi:hypothetical protein